MRVGRNENRTATAGVGTSIVDCCVSDELAALYSNVAASNCETTSSRGSSVLKKDMSSKFSKLDGKMTNLEEQTKQLHGMVDEKTKEVVDVDSDLSFLLSSPDKLDKTEGNLEEAAEIILV